MSTLKLLLKPLDYLNLIGVLNQSLGLPDVKIETSCFCAMESRDIEAHLILSNSNLEIKFLNKYTESNQKIREYLTTTSGNSLLNLAQLLNQMGFNKCSVGKSVLLVYRGIVHDKSIELKIRIGSLVGTFVEVQSDIIDTINDICGISIMEYVADRLSSEKTDNVPMSDSLISNGNFLNRQLLEHANAFNMDLLNTQRTLQDHSVSKTNDYSHLATAFHMITGKDFINGKCFFPILPSVSIVIPTYNSEESLDKVLSNISKQDYLNSIQKNIEIIIIDDGSFVSIKDHVSAYDNLNIKIVRFEKNLGLSHARNVGSRLATGEVIIFLDSDIILPKNYISTHAIRHACFDNIVTFGLKKNIISGSDVNLEYDHPPTEFDDFRAGRMVEKDKKGLYSVHESVETSILNETDNLKHMGHGRVIGIYDLPAMVVGHNLCIRRSTLSKIGGFSTDFTGWGMEDSFFGLECIRHNLFVVPLLTTGVYHIDHPPRSGSDEQKNKEFGENLEKYKIKINK